MSTPPREPEPPRLVTEVPKVVPPRPQNITAPRGEMRDVGRPAAHATPLPPLLKDPLPRVTAILVANDRRFATIDDGHIITIGDVIGKRTVVAIDERSVVLREPSGVEIRVGLGGRLEGIVRGR